MESLFCNIVIILKIMLAPPVSVTKSERCFCKLNLIKHYLRSRISQERLVGLSITSNKTEICHGLDVNIKFNNFAAMKARYKAV